MSGDFKTITFLKRRGDIDMVEFVRRYEAGHAKLGERLLRGSATRYVRRYLHGLADPETGIVDDSGHDVAMEI